MKPKHHFLIHYSRIMKSIGPLLQISCMRNESKHRDGKVTSHVAICRKNVCDTIAIKQKKLFYMVQLTYNFCHVTRLIHGLDQFDWRHESEWIRNKFSIRTNPNSDWSKTNFQSEIIWMTRNGSETDSGMARNNSDSLGMDLNPILSLGQIWNILAYAKLRWANVFNIKYTLLEMF